MSYNQNMQVNSQVRTILMKKPCRKPTCPLTNDPNHNLSFFHICPAPYDCKDFGDYHHRQCFVHFCMKGSTCALINSKPHSREFIHDDVALQKHHQKKQQVQSNFQQTPYGNGQNFSQQPPMQTQFQMQQPQQVMKPPQQNMNFQYQPQPQPQINPMQGSMYQQQPIQNMGPPPQQQQNRGLQQSMLNMGPQQPIQNMGPSQPMQNMGPQQSMFNMGPQQPVYPTQPMFPPSQPMFPPSQPARGFEQPYMKTNQMGGPCPNCSLCKDKSFTHLGTFTHELKDTRTKLPKDFKIVFNESLEQVVCLGKFVQDAVDGSISTLLAEEKPGDNYFANCIKRYEMERLQNKRVCFNYFVVISKREIVQTLGLNANDRNDMKNLMKDIDKEVKKFDTIFVDQGVGKAEKDGMSELYEIFTWPEMLELRKKLGLKGLAFFSTFAVSHEIIYATGKGMKFRVKKKPREPCKAWKKCKQLKSPAHISQYRHPCPDWENCKKTKDRQHVSDFLHPCKWDDECRNMKNEIHLERFLHPCPKGPLCRKKKSSRHMLKYWHPNRNFMDRFIQGFIPQARGSMSGGSSGGSSSGGPTTTSSSSLGGGSGGPLPSGWGNPKAPDFFKNPTHLKRVAIPSGSAEFKDVANRFKAGGVANAVKKIERIENYPLYEDFLIKRRKVSRGGKNVNEQRLFHGSSVAVLDLIAKQGFDFRVASAGKFGKGAYFSPQSSLSKGFCKGGTCMILARVIVGQTSVQASCTATTRAFVRPPAIPNDPNNKHFDSVSYNSGGRVSEVIVYELGMSYPEYMIFF